MNNGEKFQRNEIFRSKVLGTCHSEISKVLEVVSEDEKEVIEIIKKYLLNPSATFLCTDENSEIIRKFINLVNFGLACIDYKGNIIYSNEFMEYIIGEGKEKIDIEKIQEDYPELQLMKIADNWDLLFLTENYNRQLHNEINILEESFTQENMIYRISCELNKKENIEEILATIMNYLNELIPVDRTCFAQFYRQNNTEYLEAVCSQTISSESFIPAGSNKKISSENKLYKIIRDGEIEIINDVESQLASQNPQSQFTKRVVDEGMFSSMRIPIKDEEQNPIGVLFMNSSEKNVYEKSHLEVLEKLRPFLTSALTRIQKNQKLAEDATYDELTKLNNRKAFEEYFHEITQEFLKNFKEGKEKKAALIFMDIDHFKSFNDAYGHEIGDDVLKKIAEILQNSVRESELVFRRGGRRICSAS